MVRKLPTSHSYVQQHIYENRSPLHTINNVSYKFNSHTTRFNLEEWGLVALSTPVAQVAKRLGCSAQFIYERLKTINIPTKLKKIKTESLEQNNNDVEGIGEELVESNSSLFCNAMTQTEHDSSSGDSINKENSCDVAIQAVSSTYSIGCQTLENQSSTVNRHNDDDDLPIMKIIRYLNENQLMAVHSFAELIKEPPVAGPTAMDMYKIQTKMMDIYKISQIPSAVMTTQTQIVNRQPIIQSVQGADGTHFSINDPRAQPIPYNNRTTSNIDPRHNRTDGYPPSAYHNGNNHYYGGHQYSGRSSIPATSHQYPQPYANDHQPPGTVKKYGRGALRR